MVENEEKLLCYTNSVLVLLMNLTPSAGSLNWVHVENTDTSPKDLLRYLNQLALEHWLPVVINETRDAIRAYLTYLPQTHRFGVAMEASGLELTGRRWIELRGRRCGADWMGSFRRPARKAGATTSALSRIISTVRSGIASAATTTLPLMNSTKL